MYFPFPFHFRLPLPFPGHIQTLNGPHSFRYSNLHTPELEGRHCDDGTNGSLLDERRSLSQTHSSHGCKNMSNDKTFTTGSNVTLLTTTNPPPPPPPPPTIYILGAGSMGLLLASMIRCTYPSYPIRLLLHSKSSLLLSNPHHHHNHNLTKKKQQKIIHVCLQQTFQSHHHHHHQQ